MHPGFRLKSRKRIATKHTVFVSSDSWARQAQAAALKQIGQYRIVLSLTRPVLSVVFTNDSYVRISATTSALYEELIESTTNGCFAELKRRSCGARLPNKAERVRSPSTLALSTGEKRSQAVRYRHVYKRAANSHRYSDKDTRAWKPYPQFQWRRATPS